MPTMEPNIMLKVWPKSRCLTRLSKRDLISELGQTRPGRADGRSGHVGYPPNATDCSGASNFAMCQQRSRSNTVAGTKSHG
jgi:hypothetical protein